jgi:hypothetical protein
MDAGSIGTCKFYILQPGNRGKFRRKGKKKDTLSITVLQTADIHGQLRFSPRTILGK